MGTYNRKDHFYRKAKDEGYRSRAAYKLLEIDQKHALLRHGMKVFDCGCFPGGWLQVAQQRVGASGLVVGVDLRDVTPFTDAERGQYGNPVIMVGDVTELELQREVICRAGGLVDIILSDMSPKLTGIRFRDAACSAALVETVFEIAPEMLKPGGSIVAKIFPGAESDELFKRYKKNFGKFVRTKLKATRKTSDEFYFVATDYIPKNENN